MSSKKPFGAATVYVILGLVFIAIIGIRTISTPEIWTHLAQGRTNAPISYLEAEHSVNTTHLYDKVVYGLWGIGGAPALIIVNVICLLAAFILLLKVSSKWGGELSQGFALLLSGHLIFQGVDVGPQTMMMLFIALFVYLLSTVKKPAIMFGVLIPLQILWANTHGSFLFGPVIAVIATIQAAQNAKGSNRKKQQSLESGTLGILTVALLVATLLNPYVAKLHGQVIANIMHPAPVYWSSLLRDYFQIPTQNPLIFLALGLGAGGLITLKKKLPIMLTTLAIIGSFLLVRSFLTAQLFTALAFPFLVLSFSAVGEYLSGSFKTLLGKQGKLLAPATQGIFALLIILSLIPIVSNCAYATLGSASAFGLGVQEELYPSGAEAVIGHSAFPEKALNLSADGGYLAWKYPGRKIFIDYRPGRYDSELLENFTAMMLGNPAAYDTIFEAHRPEAIIINTLPPSSAQGLITLLSRRIWRMAYFDGTTAILLLNKEEFAPILNDKEVQAAGLAKLEAARAAYAAKIEKKSCAANSAELIGSGKTFLALNRPTESKAIFSLLLQGNNKIPGAWIGLGNSQLMLKEFDAAVESLNTATKLAPNSVLAWVSYANACKYAGKSDEQSRATEKAKHLIEQNKSKKPEEQEPLPEALEESTNASIENIEIPE
jgi:tetratricopeptide (TPR) repeat protein